MSSCVFILRQKRRSGFASIFVRIQGRSPKVNIRQTTHLKVDPRLWRLNRNSRSFHHFSTSWEGQILFAKLGEIEMTLNAQLNQGQGLSAAQTRAIISRIVFGEKMENAAGGVMDFNAYLDQYISDIAAGRRMTFRGTRFSPSTVASLRVSAAKLRDYQHSRRVRLDFEDLTLRFFRDYVVFLQSEGYRVNYISKVLSNLKTIIGCAEEDGYKVHPAFRSHTAGVAMTEVDSVYLTRDELERIKALDLEGMPEHFRLTRDVFLIGVWTAQRISDYDHLEKSALQDEMVAQETEDGVRESRIRTLHIVQKKTRKKVIVPCSSELLTILDRYPQRLPSVPHNILNRDIKQIGEMAGIDTPVEVRSIIGGEKVRKILPKYRLLHSHTARLTGATLMYLSGMNVFDICRITGHASVKTLQRYIKADELETVQKITARYSYFR